MPETAQLELVIRTPAPAATPAEVEQLVAVLREAADWRTAREIAALMGDGCTDRDVRAIASVACPAVVSYPGSPGYKLWTLCTIEEVWHCIDAIESQGRDMYRRAGMYRVAYHRRFRGTPPSA